MLRLGILVSGGGTNLQAIVDAINEKRITSAEIGTVVSSRQGVFALERAKKNNIPFKVISRKEYNNKEEFDSAILKHMRDNNIDLIVMAGFLCIIGEKLIQGYKNRIINVHPSLIPSFCGDGCYGLKVHQMALEYGVKVTGATVHFINEITDGGPIILQKAVDIEEDDNAESLQKRVMEEAEWVILPKAIQLIGEGKVKVNGRKVKLEI